MSKSTELSLAVQQEESQDQLQSEMLDHQAHQKDLEMEQAYEEGYIKALINPPARGKFNLDRPNEAIRRLNELNKGVL